MCYSAQIAESYHKYLRLTGAEMDLEQFLELVGFRAAGAPVRIPRVVDRWFRDPATGVEREIRGQIDHYRASMVTKLEKELFTQRRRLADAERTIAVKPTKAATESQRIATSKIEKARRDLPLYTGDEPTALDARIFPFTWVPVVMQEGARRVVRLARYHCRPAGSPAAIDRKYPGLYSARRDSLQKFWRNQFGQTHALMLCESFYENVSRDGRNAVLHFTPRPAETMLVACLVSAWDGPEGRLLSFAAITDEPPAEVAATGHDRMIISIRPENVDRWLTPAGRSPQELQEILDDRRLPYYEHELLAA